MNKWKRTSYILSFSALAAFGTLAACSSSALRQVAPQTQTSVQVLNSVSSHQTAFSFNHLRPIETPDKTIADFRRLDGVLTAAKNGNDVMVAQFLVNQSQSAMAESVRNEWLSSLGRRGQIQQFAQEYRKLAADGRNQEVRCYAHYYGVEVQANEFIYDLFESTGKLPQGCNALLQEMARQGAFNPSRAWRRVRGLISNGHITDANHLANALGSSLNGTTGQGVQENLLRNIISPNAQKTPDAAAERLNALSGSLNREQMGFAWGVLALAHAKNQNMTQALQFYRLAERSQLNTEQLEWYARAALRLQQWQEVNQVIRSMPAKLQADPTWQYWLARSYAVQGKHTQAQPHFQAAAQTGRNFYAILATEELGGRINTQNNVAPASDAQVQHLAKDGAIHRALSLYYTSKQNGDWKMRRQAQAEWRYATRGMSEATLLAAAKLAFGHEFYEMAINSAERTNQLLDYPLRYPTPFRNLISHYAVQHGVNPAWVYGLIRQESRFVMGAQSSVGAQGLMQVMPATANEIARKIGMNSRELYTMDGNIRMGTWYMADARRNLQNNEVLATAGYNAGPGRARKWQAGHRLEGAIYAETIPFTETRDYVKKVMANTAYYSSIMGQTVSLKQLMGIIPAR
ncbi:MAG: transglycosylase SLT domain-containing protein [Alysiella sp.]|uniref:lytic transglycosylase domain-containing protein n=1 Tax=Alysiella sp. TaxID=1872483 RepID=UPI0026DB4550|nr:lytic transglycosylase domain-containing protein [Alysiella sp.]MDO4433891.1 transglycosylase SLT domain-containing protein [Alysiella sp.]